MSDNSQSPPLAIYAEMDLLFSTENIFTSIAGVIPILLMATTFLPSVYRFALTFSFSVHFFVSFSIYIYKPFR